MRGAGGSPLHGGGPGWDAHALLFSVIRCLSTYKPIRCSFCVHNKAGQNAFYERGLSSEKWLLKESDSLHMRFQFAQGLVVLGFFSSIQVMKILTLFQSKKLCLSFQQSFPRTRAHSVAFSFSSLSFFIFFFLITGERREKGKKRKTMFGRNTQAAIISFILIT